MPTIEPSTALVTGGGTGIGRAVALALARRGVSVALVGRRRAPLEQVAAEIVGLGGRALAVPTDLADAGQRAQLCARTHAALGPIDVLVNNAGVLAGGELAALTPKAVESAVCLNLAVPMLLTQQYLPELAARRGAVVLVGSMMSLVPVPAASVYSASKAGLRAFGLALRPELRAHGIRLLTVYPPGVATAMTAHMARKTPWRAPLADPASVGERIVRALLAGRQELQWGSGERLLALAYRLMPRVVAALLASQRVLLVRIMTEERDG